MTRRDDPPPHDVRGGDRYVLRSLDAREIRRLEGQHRVWRALVLEVLEEAGFGRGDAVLDLGCGPGYLAAELAHVVGPEGRVTGIDSSGHFIAHLEDLAHRESTPWLTGVVGDVRNRWAEPGTLDGVTCRWVLMFVEGAERVLARVAEALRPGGVFLGMEYFDFRASALHPVGEAFATTFDAVHAQISAAGGDPDVGGRLPGMVEEAGLEVQSLRTVLRSGRPRDSVWAWLEALHDNHRDLVRAGYLRRDELEAYYREWDEASRRPGAFVTAPPVLVVIARRPGG